MTPGFYPSVSVVFSPSSLSFTLVLSQGEKSEWAEEHVANISHQKISLFSRDTHTKTDKTNTTNAFIQHTHTHLSANILHVRTHMCRRKHIRIHRLTLLFDLTLL